MGLLGSNQADSSPPARAQNTQALSNHFFSNLNFGWSRAPILASPDRHVVPWTLGLSSARWTVNLVPSQKAPRMVSQFSFFDILPFKTLWKSLLTFSDHSIVILEITRITSKKHRFSRCRQNWIRIWNHHFVNSQSDILHRRADMHKLKPHLSCSVPIKSFTLSIVHFCRMNFPIAAGPNPHGVPNNFRLTFQVWETCFHLLWLERAVNR